MSKNLYAAFMPLLAAIAFAAMPAAAQAIEPQWEVCTEVVKETGKRATIKCETEKAKSDFEWKLVGNLSSSVLTLTQNVSGKTILLENEAKTAGITCETAKDESYVWNRASRGRDINEVEFSGKCKGVGGLAACSVTEPIVVEAATRLEEEAATKKFFNKYSAVSGEPFTEITLSGATCPKGNPVTAQVAGTARGEVPERSSKQKFNGGEFTLTLFGEKWEITGEVEMEGAARKEGIRVS